MKKGKINCFSCKHFFTTWDDRFPRGCKAMDFKSRKMPSVVVYEASDMPCVRFKAKKQ
jgi:hypothetical protein